MTTIALPRAIEQQPDAKPLDGCVCVRSAKDGALGARDGFDVIVGEDAEEGRHLLGQNERLRVREVVAEHRRAEDDAGDDLADDRRLREVGEQRADAARDDDDDDQREQHVHERVEVARAAGRAEGRLAGGHLGRQQREMVAKRARKQALKS